MANLRRANEKDEDIDQGILHHNASMLICFTIITPQMITVVDFDGLSLFGGDSRFNRALGKSSEMSALYYPQVLATFLITAVHA